MEIICAIDTTERMRAGQAIRDPARDEEFVVVQNRIAHVTYGGRGGVFFCELRYAERQMVPAIIEGSGAGHGGNNDETKCKKEPKQAVHDDPSWRRLC